MAASTRVRRLLAGATATGLLYVQGHWHHYWVKGYWDCRHM
ncbi:hypothetical protein [Streptomyces aureus]|nr:hypothetical protein [Streptomyces aureus]